MSGGRFDRCFAETLGHEGGYSNHPADRGGRTHFGITEGTLAKAKTLRVLPSSATIKTLTIDQAKRVYFEFYWNPPSCYLFPIPLDLLLFDAYVNHRPGSAVRLIQLAVLSDPDGLVGPDTLSKANDPKLDLAQAIERYAAARRSLFLCIVDDDESQRVFLRGWMNRVENLCASAHSELVAA